MALRSSRIIAFIAFFIFTYSTSVFAWPWDKKENTVKAAPSNTAPKTVVSSPQTAPTARAVSSSTSQRDEDFFKEQDEEEEEEGPVIPQLPQIPQSRVQGLPEIPKTIYTPQTAGIPQKIETSSAGAQINTQAIAIQDPEIVRIQAQIKEIVKINESLKANFAGQAAEIQKINDQAVIHQKILKDLDETKKMSDQGNAENYLNREKVRLIEEQTEKNQKFIQDLKSQAVPPAAASANLPNPIETNAEKKV